MKETSDSHPVFICQCLHHKMFALKMPCLGTVRGRLGKCLLQVLKLCSGHGRIFRVFFFWVFPSLDGKDASDG